MKIQLDEEEQRLLALLDEAAKARRAELAQGGSSSELEAARMTIETQLWGAGIPSSEFQTGKHLADF